MQNNETLKQEVAALGGLSREELVARWSKHHGCPPPRGVRRELLIHSAAWHLQAKWLGSFSTPTRRKLRDAVTEIEAGNIRRRADGDANSRDSAHDTAPPLESKAWSSLPGMVKQNVRQAPEAGSRLVRDWNGRTYVVDVLRDGFVFEGEVYRSLSVIARKITGAHWSGPRFFSL